MKTQTHKIQVEDFFSLFVRRTSTPRQKLRFAPKAATKDRRFRVQEEREESFSKGLQCDCVCTQPLSVAKVVQAKLVYKSDLD